MQNGIRAWLSSRPDPEDFRAPMGSPSPWLMRLENVQRGINNTHIDVVLSRQFQAQANVLIKRFINQDIALNYWSDAGPTPEHEDMEGFRGAYQSMMEATLAKASKHSNSQLPALLHLATTKYLLQLTDREFGRLQVQVRQAKVRESELGSGKALELHDRLVVLAKEEATITYRVKRRLFRFIMRLENTVFRKIRKSTIGVSWPVPKEALFNPLLHIASIASHEQFMNHYPLLLGVADATGGFSQTNSIFTDVFQDYLPTWVGSASPTDSTPSGREHANSWQNDLQSVTSFEGIRSYLSQMMLSDEYSQFNLSWLDVPENFNLFINSVPVARVQPRVNGKADVSIRPWPDKHWPDFQRRTVNKLTKAFERAGMVPLIIASYRTQALHRELGGCLSAKDIYLYFCGELSRRKLAKRLPDDDVNSISRLDGICREIEQTPASKRQNYVLRFLYDFLVFRRDLKFAHKTYETMERLRFLESAEDINLSRANGSLHEFYRADEADGEHRQIRSHVVLKADVRGSTAMTSQLRASQLNPASHFSLNFFEPINKLLEEFDATKVFLEGDAVILAFFEYEGDDVRWLTVARACSLASRILEVINVQNERNRSQGLPALELGLGIAFDNDSPTFLYDEKRKIMISPAINRADRLSSCSPELHACTCCLASDGKVQVAVRPAEEIAQSAHLATLLRYNVGGIELDAVAFQKLQSEVRLKKVKGHVKGMDETDGFYAARYSDRQGKSHWLFVREANVRTWNGTTLTEDDSQGRCFYEVITDIYLIKCIKAQLQHS